MVVRLFCKFSKRRNLDFLLSFSLVFDRVNHNNLFTFIDLSVVLFIYVDIWSTLNNIIKPMRLAIPWTGFKTINILMWLLFKSNYWEVVQSDMILLFCKELKKHLLYSSQLQKHKYSLVSHLQLFYTVLIYS
jgi:hypothetical protein